MTLRKLGADPAQISLELSAVLSRRARIAGQQLTSIRARASSSTVPRTRRAG